MPGRVFSFFQNPNAFANLLVYFIPLMAAMIFYSPGWREKLFFLLVTGAAGLVILLTGSRGGWLSLAAAFFVLALCLCPRWVPLLILIALFALPFLPDFIKARIMSIFAGDSSISSRNYIYSAVVRLLEGNWFLGVGLGTTALRRSIAYYGVYHAWFPFVHAHNILLEIWAESGVFAAFSFIAAICASFAKGLAARKRARTPLLKAIVSGSVAGLTGSMVFGLTDYAWSFPRIMVLFWFLIAILYSAIKLTKSGEAAAVYN
jgi:O-antigen ligase